MFGLHYYYRAKCSEKSSLKADKIDIINEVEYYINMMSKAGKNSRFYKSEERRKRMRHKLDIRPIPENTLYVNKLSICDQIPYETKKQVDQALTGKTISQGGILPEDNVRIYVPLDLSEEAILRRLQYLYYCFGMVSEKNEGEYSSGVSRLVSQLEIYDQVRVARDIETSIQKEPGGIRHSLQGIELARKMIKVMEENEGCGECFPYEQINELKKEFWLK